MMPFTYVAVTVSIVRIPQGILGPVLSWTHSSGEGGLPDLWDPQCQYCYQVSPT